MRVPVDRMLGTLSCASASCHGSHQPLTSGKGQEYLRWLGGTQEDVHGRPHYDSRAKLATPDGDPHAIAGQRLQEPRFQEVLRRVSSLPSGAIDSAVYARCADCHDPLGQAGHVHAGQASDHLLPTDPRFTHGIGCESCHGGARDWVATHYQSGVSRPRLAELGMIDTKDVLTRARVCSACHVGSAENNVDHELIAAGHPPLRFEMASYQALIARKHWNDAPRRLAERDYEFQLWVAGRVASTDAALARLESRARDAAATDETQMATDRNASVWPEFAEYNCFACHQSLRPNSRGGVRRGLPWQSWDVALAPLSPSADEALGQVRTAMERLLVADPHEILKLAAKARSNLREAEYSMSAKEVLARFAGQEPPQSWERACQQLALTVALERGNPNQEVHRRAKNMGQALRFSSLEFELPAVLSRPPSDGSFQSLSLEEAGEELKTLLQLLAKEGSDP